MGRKLLHLFFSVKLYFSSLLFKLGENLKALIPVLADELLDLLRHPDGVLVLLWLAATFLHDVKASGSSNVDHLLGEIVENSLDLRVLFAELLILQKILLLSFVDASELLESFAA